MNTKTTSRSMMGLALLAVLSLALSACGLQTSSVMTVDSTFAGERVITVDLSNSDIEENLGGDVTAAENTIVENLPDELTFSGSEAVEEGRRATFTLTFSSFDDYRTKVTSLLAYSGIVEPVIHRVQSDDGLVTGVQLEEDFTDADLLRWMEDPLVSNGIVSEDNRGSIFDFGSQPILKIGDETYTSQNTNMTVRNIVDHRADTGLVTVDLRPQSYLETRVVLGSNESSGDWVGKRKPLVKEYLESHLPSGATLSDDPGFISEEPLDGLVVTLQPADVDELNSQLQELTGNDDNAVTIEDPQIGTNMSLSVAVSSSMDLGALATPSDMDPYRVFFITPETWVVADEYSFDTTATTSDGLMAYSSYDPLTPASFELPIPLQATHVKFDLNSSGGGDIAITFDVNNTLAGDFGDMVEESMEGLLSIQGDYSHEENGDISSYTVTISGDNSDELSGKLSSFEPGSSVYSYDDSSWLFHNVVYSMYLPLRYGYLANHPDIPIDYQVQLPSLHWFGDESEDVGSDSVALSRTLRSWTSEPGEDDADILFTDHGPRLLLLIPLAIVLLLLIAAIVLIVVFRKKIAAALAARREARAQRAARAPIPGGPRQGMPPQGVPPQGMPPQGMPPQGMPPQGMPPQGVPPQGMPPQGVPPQGMPPQGVPPQGMPPQGVPPQGAPAAPGTPVSPGSPASPSAPPTPVQQPPAAPPANPSGEPGSPESDFNERDLM